MVSRIRFGWLLTTLAIAFVGGPSVRAEEVQGYGFQAAAQEITQLFWLADTATACGWTTDADALRFKHFSVRFLSAHLSDAHRAALMTLVTENDYEGKVRRVALEGAQHNCDSSRWRLGWVSYKAAADEHEREF